MTVREEIVELVNKLFIYTDEQNWDGLKTEVFAEEVHLDMTSLGGEASDTTAQAICDMWKAGFEGIDSINHLAGNYLIDIDDKNITAFAYATATHYKESAKNGKTREFVGTYEIKITGDSDNWRIHFMKYNLKYMTGNLDLR